MPLEAFLSTHTQLYFVPWLTLCSNFEFTWEVAKALGAGLSEEHNIDVGICKLVTPSVFMFVSFESLHSGLISLNKYLFTVLHCLISVYRTQQ